ncbi:MAG: protease pro-enzyme activation domain-containing protein, partial [Solirubrobacteraceae bacterium]
MHVLRVLGVGWVAALSLCAVIAAPAAAAGPSRVELRNSQSPAAARTPRTGSVPSKTSIDFQVNLRLSNEQAAQSFAQSVSKPGSPSYGRYLTPHQWEARFSPSAADVASVRTFLRQSGFTVGSVPADRLFVPASGTAAQIERAFETSLAYHRVQGSTLRLATTNLTVPASVAGVIANVSGVNQTLMRPTDTTGAAKVTRPAATSGKNIPQPPGFRVATPCGQYFNQAIDTTLPPYGHGYPANPPWAVCGYTGAQLRLAYGLTTPDTGKGVTVGIVDAYTSPTLFSDAHTFAHQTDPGNPLKAGQFSELPAKSYNEAGANECDAPGWFGEETLDVEAVHDTAPGANILFAGARNCSNGLIVSLNK